jgi:hypothetical protein
MLTAIEPQLLTCYDAFPQVPKCANSGWIETPALSTIGLIVVLMMLEQRAICFQHFFLNPQLSEVGFKQTNLISLS